MKKVSGIIEDIKIRSGQGSRGPWTLYLIKVNGEIFQTFNKSLGDKLRRGQKVTFHYEEKETTKNGTTYRQKVIYVPSSTERLTAKVEELIKICKENQELLKELKERQEFESGECPEEVDEEIVEENAEEIKPEKAPENEKEEIDISEIPF